MEQIPALIDEILTTHHAYLKAEIPRLSEALRRAPPALARPWGDLARLLEGHLMKEETILFPNLLALARGADTAGCGFAGPVAQMRHEHEQIRVLEEELRRQARFAGPEEDALLALLDDLAVHAAKEDERLFALAPGVSPEPDIESEIRLPPPPARSAPAPRPSRLARLVRRLTGRSPS